MKTVLDIVIETGPKKQIERYIFLSWKLTGKRKAVGQDFGESRNAANEATTNRQKNRVRDGGIWYAF